MANEMLWIPNHSFATAMEDKRLVASLVSSAAHRLRGYITASIVAFANREASGAINFFGGLVRRTIYAAHMTTVHREKETAWPPLALPSECFIEPSVDMDIRFENLEDMQGVEDMLTDEFKVVAGDVHPAYFGSCVRRLRVTVRHCLLGTSSVVMIDLVKPEMGCMFLPDFDVNQLMIEAVTGEMSLSVPQKLRKMWSPPPPSIALLSGRYSNYALCQQIHESIYQKEAKLMLLSAAVYKDTFEKNDEDYDRYVHILFGRRLVKMLRGGWTITNLTVGVQNQKLVLECGRVLEYRDLRGSLLLTPDAVEIACPNCAKVCTLFRHEHQEPEDHYF